MNIKLNLSEAFHNKTNLSGNKSDFGFSFYPRDVELWQLKKHILQGKAFTVGYFKGNSRAETQFVSSQLLALDLDDCSMDLYALINWSEFINEYAFMMYPTPSSTAAQPKTRILFVLDQPVQESSRWRVLQLALMEHFAEIKPDEPCKDPARLFYGCDTKDYYINYEALLPVALVGGLVLPLAEREDFSRLAKAYTVKIHRGDSDLQRCATNYLNHALKRVSAAGQGSKHKTFVNYAMWLYGLNAGGWPITKSEIESGLTSIAQAWEDTEKTIKNNLGWAERNAKAIEIDEVKVSPRGSHVQLLKMQERYSK